MFLGALYPSAPNERQSSARRQNASEMSSRAVTRGSGKSAATPLATHRANGPCVGIVDCRDGPSRTTGLPPMALQPLSSSAPAAVASVRHRTKPPQARSRSTISTAVAVAALNESRHEDDDDGDYSPHRSRSSSAVPALPHIGGPRGRANTVDWSQREARMEEAETRRQIAALPDALDEESDEDEDDDVSASARGADGERDCESTDGLASPHTTEARRLVGAVRPPFVETPSAVARTSSEPVDHGGGQPCRAKHGHTGRGRAHPLWHFQASLLLTRRTRLFTDVFAPYCRAHTRMQLVLSKADYLWEALLAEEGLRGSLLQSTWEEAARDVHPLVWLMSTRHPSTAATAVVTSTAVHSGSAASGGAVRGVGTPGWRTGDGTYGRPTSTQSRRLPSTASDPHATSRSRRTTNRYDTITGGMFETDSACLRLLSDHMAHAKASIPAVLDVAHALLSQPPLKPLYRDELGRVFHALSHELTRQMHIMTCALQRLEEIAREKERDGNAREWMLTLLRLCSDAAKEVATATRVHAYESTAAAEPAFSARADTQEEEWAPTTTAPQEPSVGDVQVCYDLVEALHTTGVASLKPEHLLDALAVALAPFAAPVLLTVRTSSLVYGPQRHATAAEPKAAQGATVSASTAVPDVKEADLALALFSLHALGADPSVFAQRDVTYSLQEVATLIQCACLLCESRQDEEDAYVGRTVRFAAGAAVKPAPSPTATSSRGAEGASPLRAQVDALLAQLWDTGVYQVNSHFLRQLMRERAPRFQEALRRVHRMYTTGKSTRPEPEVALDTTFLKSCYALLPSPTALGAKEPVVPSRGTAPTAAAAHQLDYGAAQRTHQDTGRRQRNAYICADVQRRFANSFYLTAVCHESVAQLREQSVTVLWRLFAPEARSHVNRHGGDGGDNRFFLLSTNKRATDSRAQPRRPRGDVGGDGSASTDRPMQGAAFTPTLRRASAAFTPGYHLNDRTNPLLLPNTPPSQDTLRWLARRVQQRSASNTVLPAHDKVTALGADSAAPSHTEAAGLYSSGLVMDIFKVSHPAPVA